MRALRRRRVVAQRRDAKNFAVKLASFGVIAALVVPRAGFAQEEAIRLEFEAGGGCPGRPEFMAQVRARTERVHFLDLAPDAGADAVREFKVTAGPEGDRAVGRLRLGKTEDADRLVTGKTCAEVISALALIAAVAIDPAASLGVIESPVTTALPSPSPLDQSPTEPVPPLSPPPDVAAPPRPSNEPARASLPWFGGVGAHGEVTRGFGSDAFTLVGASIYGEVGLAFGETWRPVVRLSGVASWSPTLEPNAQPDVGAANLRLLAARLSACPIAYRFRGSFDVRPCASFELGRLDATAKQVPNGKIVQTREDYMTRVAIGQSVQARMRLMPAVWMELELGANEPLLRQNFVFRNPDVPVSSVSVVEIAGALGLGLHFP
jgi:hypothetical protein